MKVKGEGEWKDGLDRGRKGKDRKEGWRRERVFTEWSEKDVANRRALGWAGYR